MWGPTCAPDQVVGDILLPRLEVGDWLYYEDMGAYSFNLDCGFNGFPKPVVYYYVSDSHKYV